MSKPSIIVVGGLNTDIFALGITDFPKPGGHVYGKQLHIGPGGKSRNIAEMAGRLSDSGTVAMIGRTVKDEYGLGEVPVCALEDAGVNTDSIVYADPKSGGMPGVALIPVSEDGENQIFVLAGVNDDLSGDDVDAAGDLWTQTTANHGILTLSLECPLPTVQHAIEKARGLGIRAVLDPGGLQAEWDVSVILKAGIFLLKPNEHEAEILTGIPVVDADSANRAATQLLGYGIQYVMITVGEKGAYVFGEGVEEIIPIPEVPNDGIKNAAGCGDQATAALCVALNKGKSVVEAARAAVVAGTLQYHQNGIVPIKKEELSKVVGGL